MTKIVIDDAIPYVKGVLEPFCDVQYLDGRKIRRSDIAYADALMVRTRTRCEESLLSGSRVRAIATATIGYDHIDMDFCREAGIEVFTAAGCNARGVLQWFGAVLVHAARLQGWEPIQKTIGVVGTGNVGALAAEYGKIWGFEVLCCDPPRKEKGLPSPVEGGYVSLTEIARRCDIITFHTPLTLSGLHATRHMAGREFFDSLQPGTLVLNASRGEVFDTEAFRDAALSGRCVAAVDTWEHEPDIDRGFLRATMLGTPHIAGYTAQGKANASALSVDALARFFGFPLRGWYPRDQVEKTVPRKISWNELCRTILPYFDIAAESHRLKDKPGDFEAIRTGYLYRQEYF